MKGRLLGISLIAAAAAVSACGNVVKEVPAGYVGKVLTPTGWQDKILTAGQVDLGEQATNGTYNVLVLLEASSLTMKEQFMEAAAAEDKQDHRVMTKSRVPLAVDVYVQIAVPSDVSKADDKRMVDSIYAQVTPVAVKDDNRVRLITLKDVYYRFASMTIRGKTRAIFAKYNDDEDVLKNYQRVNDEVAAMVIDTFKDGKVPLQLLSAQISNVKVDPEVWKMQAIMASANAQVEAINKVGAAMKANPQYQTVLKWNSLKDIAQNGSAKGVNTIIITDGNDAGAARAFTAAEYTAERVAAMREK